MPVNVLYCEGDDKKSLDIQILKNIVPASCFIKPIGSKHGFIHRILGARGIQANKIVTGIKDRDFAHDESTNMPHEWYATINNERVQLGWYWDRKEIENYLTHSGEICFELYNSSP